MRKTMTPAVIALVAVLLMTGGQAVAADGKYRLEFLPTFNIGEQSGAGGTMTIMVTSDHRSVIEFRVWNLFPNTVYTIWTVFNGLAWRPGYTSDTSNGVPACTASGSSISKTTGLFGGCAPVATEWAGWAEYPKEGGKVSPTGALRSAYTHGIRLDPGSTFVTDRNGNGRITFKVDFDALDHNPVSLKQLLQQCRPGTADASGKCSGDNVVDITTTWMRRFIVEYPLAQRAAMCANYDPAYDPESPEYEPAIVHHTDSRFWQCVDPDSDLVRVQRYPFSHFRIANHPDSLTHGHIGGDHNDHWIDLVGPRECIVPVGNAAPITTLEPALGTVGYTPFPLSSCKPLTNQHGRGSSHNNR